MRVAQLRGLLVVTLTLSTLFGVMGCTTILGVRTCADPSPEILATAPPTLSATGLYGHRGALGRSVLRYRPRFELVGDGEAKDRFVQLPAGSSIDSNAMDDWRFPSGTKLWKHFFRDGKPIETRYLAKVVDGDGADSWLAVAYVWNTAGTEAFVAPEGLDDANGSGHDIPPARRCRACHGGTSSFVLGLSAIQLGGPARPGDASLASLAAEGRLTRPARTTYDLPGDANTRAALGYLHANCAHCHNRRRPTLAGPRCFDPRTGFDLSLRTTELDTLRATAVYRTALGTVVTAGSPEDSLVYRRVAGMSAFEPRMPALGANEVDRNGLTLLARWIRALP